jgi:four helix bundle protein
MRRGDFCNVSSASGRKSAPFARHARCSHSMPSNIAEGFSRHSTAFYVQHLWTSHASAAELETQVELGRRLDVIGHDEGEMRIADTMEVARMINGLVRSLERAPHDRFR